MLNSPVWLRLCLRKIVGSRIRSVTTVVGSCREPEKYSMVGRKGRKVKANSRGLRGLDLIFVDYRALLSNFELGESVFAAVLLEDQPGKMCQVN